MENEIKQALKLAIMKMLPTLHELSKQYQAPTFVWKKVDDHWEGQDILEPSLIDVFIAARGQIAEASVHFAKLFFSKYPEYGPGKLVGCANLTSMQLASNQTLILSKALGCLWERHETFSCDEKAVDTIVSEFEAFIDFNKIRVRFQSELINFQMAVPNLPLTTDFVIRKLKDREISAFQNRGGPRRNLHNSPTEFIIEGEFDGIKTFSGDPPNSENPLASITSKLNTMLRCLRTFKDGSVGLGWLHLSFVKFCPLDLGSYWSLDRFILPGVYNITNEEIEKFSSHAHSLFDLSESAMETACSRLTDAEGRFRPQDQILDAVIGMEVLLLAGLRPDDRRSELKYRFSLNYSALHETPEERWHAYKIAKGFYDLRSRIAHGDDIQANIEYPLGNEKLKIQEIAKRAKNELRTLIKRFLPQAKNAPYKNPEFWERSYFGISEKI